MSKRMAWGVAGGILCLLVLALIMILVFDNHLYEQENLAGPNFISSYSNKGYYKIDPETIIASLERGDKNQFTPLLEDPQSIEALTNITINWTQADFLKIASALGQFTWGDPMVSKNWKVFSITFNGSCKSPIGFESANIAYFKAEGETYITRLIVVEPYFGWVGWGDGKIYPQPILHKWQAVDLSGAKVSADDAIQIVSKDATTRFHFKNNCGIIMGSPEDNDPNNWYLHTFVDSNLILYVVNLETGQFTFQKLNK